MPKLLFFGAKNGSKTPWKPRARASTFRDLKNRFPSALGGSPGPKKAENKTLGAIFLSHRYPAGIRPVSNRPNFAHWGPWGRTIIKEFEYNKLNTGSDTPRARGPANFPKDFNQFWIRMVQNWNKILSKIDETTISTWECILA